MRHARLRCQHRALEIGRSTRITEREAEKLDIWVMGVAYAL